MAGPGAYPGVAHSGVQTFELQDFGVPPIAHLYTGAMHGPTPVSIPGGRVVTTADVIAFTQRGGGYVLLDVLGSGETLPGAISAVSAHRAGTFNDAVQGQLASLLGQHTQGNRTLPLIFYCQSPRCWMSYNAALRAINLGYRDVRWYRGGIDAWKRAGLSTQAGYAR